MTDFSNRIYINGKFYYQVGYTDLLRDKDAVYALKATDNLTQVAELVKLEGVPVIATTEVAGLVKPDGTTIEVKEDGTISVPTGSSDTLGLVQPDGDSIKVVNGAIFVDLATISSAGLTQPDGITIDISNSGIISVVKPNAIKGSTWS